MNRYRADAPCRLYHPKLGCARLPEVLVGLAEKTLTGSVVDLHATVHGCTEAEADPQCWTLHTSSLRNLREIRTVRPEVCTEMLRFNSVHVLCTRVGRRQCRRSASSLTGVKATGHDANAAVDLPIG